MTINQAYGQEDISSAGPRPGAQTSPRGINRLIPRTIQGMILGLLLIVLLPVLLVQGGISYSRYEALRNREVQANIEMARSVAATFDNYVFDILRTELALGIALASPQPLPPEQINRLLLGTDKAYLSAGPVTWINPQGRVIASSDPRFIGVDVGDRAYFQEVLGGREWAVSDLLRGRPSGEPIFVIARGVWDESGVLQGIVGAIVDPGRLGEALKVERSEQGSMTIIDRQGRIVYCYPEIELAWEQRNLMEIRPLLARTLAGEETSDNVPWITDGRNRIVGRVPIRSIGWVAVAGRPEAEVIGPLVDDLNRGLRLFLAVAVLAFAVALAISRNITVPIKRLQKAAATMGSGAIGHELRITGPTEVKDLSHTLNHMAERIHSREAQILEANQLLVVTSVRAQEQAEEAKAAERRAAFLAEASAVLGNYVDYDTTLNSIARLAVPAFADLCVVYIVLDGSLQTVAVAHVDPWKEKLLHDSSLRHLDREGPVWLVLETGQTYVAPEITKSQLATTARDVDHLRMLSELGARSGAIVPLVARGKVLGAISIRFLAAHRRSPEDLALIEELARRAAVAIDNARLYDEAREARESAERAERRSSFLAEASKVLASSLDYEATLQSVAHLAVPSLTDTCVVYISKDGDFQHVATAHLDPSKEELLRRALSDLPPKLSQLHPVEWALATGETYVIPDVPSILSQIRVGSGENLDLSSVLNLKSGLIVPLVARDRTIGMLAFGSTGPTSSFSPTDIALAEELARRAALAVDNARLYREAQEAVRVRDEFLSVASHELRTPITSLRGFTQLTLRRLAQGQFLDPQEVRNALNVIDHQSKKLAKLMIQLLDFSRIDAGKLELDLEITDLKSLVEDVVTAARHISGRQDIFVNAPSAVTALLDPVRIEQVISNLVDNAIKYSPNGGQIDVELSTADPAPETVRLMVRDRGVGIPPEHRPHIFDRFYQAHGGVYFAGMGLGLYISRQIVELHGGYIEAEFPPDGGAIFVVTLPIGPGYRQHGDTEAPCLRVAGTP